MTRKAKKADETIKNTKSSRYRHMCKPNSIHKMFNPDKSKHNKRDERRKKLLRTTGFRSLLHICKWPRILGDFNKFQDRVHDLCHNELMFEFFMQNTLVENRHPSRGLMLHAVEVGFLLEVDLAMLQFVVLVVYYCTTKACVDLDLPCDLIHLDLVQAGDYFDPPVFGQHATAALIIVFQDLEVPAAQPFRCFL
ncbi:hypothetical protein LIER_28700 [Lithospermum erythrorhizon]|uniref:Uncharacterized protein n=1 Tax=Lithospermum erythrorhizon TaxID=34254 RepID=A0AAV3RGL8_LITER